MLTDTILFVAHIPRHHVKSHLTINTMMDSIALRLWFQSCWVCGIFVMAYLNMIKMCHTQSMWKRTINPPDKKIASQ